MSWCPDVARRGPELLKGRGRRRPTPGEGPSCGPLRTPCKRSGSPHGITSDLWEVNQRRPAAKPDTPCSPWWALSGETGGSVRLVHPRTEPSAASADALTPRARARQLRFAAGCAEGAFSSSNQNGVISVRGCWLSHVQGQLGRCIDQ